MSITIELRSGADIFSKTFDLPPAVWTALSLDLSEAGKKIKLDDVTEMRISQPLRHQGPERLVS
jgi:hypothetical protein